MTRVVPVAGGITAPAGFRATGVHCGIKAKGLDLAVIVPDAPAAAAAVFTVNRAQAAPVQVSRDHLQRTGGRTAAVVVNSGCANACTGEDGVRVAREIAAHAARHAGCRPDEVFVASTGVIGVALDGGRVAAGLDAAFATLDAPGGQDLAAQAIMTTDPFPKAHAARVETAGGACTIGGMAKGSGMIEPRMATMLAFLTTDARIAPALLQRALREAVDVTFNAITVDGECSTNDCALVLAGGASGVTIEAPAYAAFVEGLRTVCERLALDIVRGGEGATKLVTVRVTGAATADEARTAARAIANSLLCKTAIHGADPNWGRFIAVAGRAGVAFALDRATMAVGPTVLFSHGRPHDERAPEAAARLREKEIEVTVDLGAGGAGEATVWTCDLSADYVRINADYRT
ncbi:MAG: bifunctional glutamate N-acetyltransferase/amino-acid acetyltransferase ArgJ [Acidobacteriota bacterium]|nr:bifunctional glutamate N-acetyltransferase/amino-acid acetyltransferase ArgJ [Acidobacteriota bacterium]